MNLMEMGETSKNFNLEGGRGQMNLMKIARGHTNLLGMKEGVK